MELEGEGGQLTHALMAFTAQLRCYNHSESDRTLEAKIVLWLGACIFGQEHASALLSDSFLQVGQCLH